jgi:hypothetical protein
MQKLDIMFFGADTLVAYETADKTIVTICDVRRIYNAYCVEVSDNDTGLLKPVYAGNLEECRMYIKSHFN